MGDRMLNALRRLEAGPSKVDLWPADFREAAGAADEIERLRAEVEKLTAERDALRKESRQFKFAGMNRSLGIATPCPTCGRSSLFVGSGGHLTCSRTGCSKPSVESAVKGMRAERDALLAAKGELVAALRVMRDVFPPRATPDMDGFVQAKAHELAEDALAKHGGES